MKRIHWVLLVLLAVFAGLFAYLNGAERVVIHLGFVTLYRVSLVGVVFGSFILGMVTMFLVGLRHDLRVRRALREYGLLQPPPPPAREEPELREEDWRATSY